MKIADLWFAKLERSGKRYAPETRCRPAIDLNIRARNQACMRAYDDGGSGLKMVGKKLISQLFK